jgi:hypothetical protein
VAEYGGRGGGVSGVLRGGVRKRRCDGCGGSEAGLPPLRRCRSGDDGVGFGDGAPGLREAEEIDEAGGEVGVSLG